MTIQEEKKILRSKMRALLKETYSDEKLRFTKSRTAAEKLIQLDCFKEADLVFIYVPKAPEADDMYVEYTAESWGKTVCVPKCGKDCSMDFYKLKKDVGLEWQLKEGAFGILEPVEDLEKVNIDSTLADKKILMVVPGTGFTEEGVRLGQGKGFYDRFIPRLKAVCKNLTVVGFCYPEQILKSVPAEETDFKMDMVIY